MKRIQLENNHYIIKWNKANELPLKRYARFQKYLLYKTGIGSDLPSVSNHFSNLHGFIAHEMLPEIKKEAENLHYNFHSILQEVNYDHLAFACMIFSIDGELVEDFSDDNLLKVISWLSDHGMTHEMCSDEIQDTRESILADLKLYFPEFYPESTDMVFFQKLKQQIMLTSDKLIEELENDKNVDDEITKMLDNISKYFVELKKPSNFNSTEHDNCVVKLESQFEALCSMIESNGGTSAKDFTLIEFYSRLSFIKKSNELANPNPTK